MFIPGQNLSLALQFVSNSMYKELTCSTVRGIQHRVHYLGRQSKASSWSAIVPLRFPCPNAVLNVCTVHRFPSHQQLHPWKCETFSPYVAPSPPPTTGRIPSSCPHITPPVNDDDGMTEWWVVALRVGCWRPLSFSFRVSSDFRIFETDQDEYRYVSCEMHQTALRGWMIPAAAATVDDDDDDDDDNVFRLSQLAFPSSSQES